MQSLFSVTIRLLTACDNHVTVILHGLPQDLSQAYADELSSMQQQLALMVRQQQQGQQQQQQQQQQQVPDTQAMMAKLSSLERQYKRLTQAMQARQEHSPSRRRHSPAAADADAAGPEPQGKRDSTQQASAASQREVQAKVEQLQRLVGALEQRNVDLQVGLPACLPACLPALCLP